MHIFLRFMECRCTIDFRTLATQKQISIWMSNDELIGNNQFFQGHIFLKKSESLQTEGRHFGPKICKLSDV